MVRYVKHFPEDREASKEKKQRFVIAGGIFWAFVVVWLVFVAYDVYTGGSFSKQLLKTEEQGSKSPKKDAGLSQDELKSLLGSKINGIMAVNQNGGIIGSAFLIRVSQGEAFFLTAAHILRVNETVQLSNSRITNITAQVVCRADEPDIAVLRASGNLEPGWIFSPANGALQPQAQVLGAGYGSNGLEIRPGVIENILSDMTSFTVPKSIAVNSGTVVILQPEVSFAGFLPTGSEQAISATEVQRYLSQSCSGLP